MPKAKKSSKNSKGKGLINKAAKPQKSNSNRVGDIRLSRGNVGAGVSFKTMRLGMSDVRAHTVSWLAGYIYVGNNTIGATDSVYFIDPTKAATVVPLSLYGSNVPVVAGDSFVGASYCTDVMKHYSRFRLTQLRLNLVPLFPSTSNSMSVVVGPQRGGANIGGLSTTTTAGCVYSNVLSMAGAKQCSSWEALSIDMTSCIAGGSGAKQNEFDVAQANGLQYFWNSTTPSTDTAVVPASFSVSGNNSTTALRGTTTHAVIFEQTMDLLDFIGGDSAQITVAAPRASRLRYIDGRSTLDPFDAKGKEMLCPSSSSHKDEKGGKEKFENFDKKDKENPFGVSKYTSDSKSGSKEDSIATKEVSKSLSKVDYDSLTTDLSKSTLFKMGYVQVNQGSLDPVPLKRQ